MPWESRRAWVGSCAAAASARTPPFVSGASGNITRASCACWDPPTAHMCHAVLLTTTKHLQQALHACYLCWNYQRAG